MKAERFAGVRVLGAPRAACAPVGVGGGGEAVVLELVVVGDFLAHRDILVREDAHPHLPYGNGMQQVLAAGVVQDRTSWVVALD